MQTCTAPFSAEESFTLSCHDATEDDLRALPLPLHGNLHHHHGSHGAGRQDAAAAAAGTCRGSGCTGFSE